MTTTIEPVIRRTRGFLCDLAGTFSRAVDPAYADAALRGSYGAGRYSRRDQRTLYLSASRAGVEAAMIAHRTGTEPARTVLSLRVQAEDIFDLRDPDAVARAREQAGEPFADWQEDLARGREPSSWRVRDWIEAQGSPGLIDPSRKAPGLWHLVLFRWNRGDGPQVRL